jgi:hypothetical protein
MALPLAAPGTITTITITITTTATDARSIRHQAEPCHPGTRPMVHTGADVFDVGC